ncbi:LAMI_0E10638g1_1 [Lachancea mirantina]|uniref:LAMI_0E10638g1_1 n=1 Tax=Lachancea mirantina TaxID=1230905 RepID=A0A1G4JPA3_9SACH|nr:LAMI_0E10638g1_1 [Lachancea mirantina]
MAHLRLPLKLSNVKAFPSFGGRTRPISTGARPQQDLKYTSKKAPPFQSGQPLFETRPFLMKRGELTPGITALEYYERRTKLATRLPAKSCAIVVGSQLKYASGPVFYPFQQNNDLFYLSGWNEPDSVMVLEKPTDNLDEVLFHLIVPPKDTFSEQWEGFRSGADGACEIFNADEATDNRQLAPYLSKIIKRNKFIYFDNPSSKPAANNSASFGSFFSLRQNPSANDTVTDIIKYTGSGNNVRGLKRIVSDLRLIKSPAEVAVMRRAGQISGRAYNQAYAKKIRNERTLQSFLEYKFISGGCEKSAYIPVVATGSNALCIHYTRNDDVMFDDEMVLVDASGSLGGYCTDISRTWPVSGKFTSAQRDLYEAVLNVQRKCIELCKASSLYSMHDLHQRSTSFLKEELRNVGFGNLTSWDLAKIYPHYIGHNLGLDVHDVPENSRHQPIQAGQVITIEPGIYIPDDANFPSHFRNMGIRIEDDIAVGVDTYTNLTVEAAKEIDDIESIAQNGVKTHYDEDVVSPLLQK